MEPAPLKSFNVALLLGAGFAKPWGLPLTSELMNFEEVKRHHFPGLWQQKTISEVEARWMERAADHGGSVDRFGQILRGTTLFEPFVRYVGLRLSSRLWHVGGAQQTKWGTGDHVAMQGRLPSAYAGLINVLETTTLTGIVTTNYDVVIEKILGPRRRGRLGGFNYGRVGEQLQGRHFTSSRGSYAHVTVTGSVPIAKIHGSLSWEFSRSGDLVHYVDCRPSRGRRYRVAVFPPGERGGNPFSSQVDLARQILASANVWIVIGYSFPPGDDDVNELIARSASHLELICVCDPRSSEIVDHLKRVAKVDISRCRCEALPGLGSPGLFGAMLSCLETRQ
jgi:hypothetical protein